ncbi:MULTISPECIES: hypothetical protein [unclassified Saccharibacter]|uniref:hypothetical protein n=1 Tax=unclassified Saccharibacter TaxID=2648722 RepID=UPI0013206C70|nr:MULTISPECIES: hypothetical protein [unclassified Saccharibacter]MXV36500.1 hypothetical protein [Saccharibacter sp. EH611]MXV57662.1 hypothetical protein [Saccharibacter sp. EH70]MXV65031.1 hypothetical protein [Saccharibacter sp. EH60]
MKHTLPSLTQLAIAILTTLNLGAPCAWAESDTAPPQSVTFEPISFDDNSAYIPKMTEDERYGTVTRTWRRTGKNQGYYVYMATMDPADYTEDMGPSNLVQIDGQDTLTTDPQHVGENSLSTIIVARRNEHNNTHSTVYLLKATRHPQKGRSITSPLPTTVDLYALTHNTPEGFVGFTPDYFQSDERNDINIGNFTSAEAALDAVVKKHLDHQTLMLLGIP